MDGMNANPDIDRLLACTAEFIDAGRFGAARPLLAAIGRLSPPTARLAELTAVLALKEGRLPDALQALDAAISSWPDNAALRKYRADVRRQMGDAIGALVDAAEAVLLDPHDPEAKAILGVLLLGLGYAENARVCLREAVGAQPANPLFLMALADALAACGDQQGAAATLDQGITLAPGEVGLRTASMLLAIRRERFEDAVEVARAAHRSGAIDACLLGLQGHALSSLERHEEAAEVYGDALKLDPSAELRQRLVTLSTR